MDTDLQADTQRLMKALEKQPYTELMCDLVSVMDLRLRALESLAAPQETTTETRWERGTTLMDAPAPCEGSLHVAPDYSPGGLYVGKVTNCRKCGITLRLIWTAEPRTLRL